MKNRACIGFLIAAAVAAAPSYAQVYKWVDSNGRVNYSSQPPADSASSRTLKVVEPNISVYTPDESLKRAVEENRQRKQHYEAAADHPYAVAARSACAEGMLPSSQGGCQPVEGSSDYYPYYSYAPAVVYGRFRRHPVQLAQAQIPAGTIAGNVVGLNGYTAGLSAQAASMAPPPARPPRVSPAGRGFAPR